MKQFQFINNSPKYRYRLVVLAKSLKTARAYVKAQGCSSLCHRGLKYIGQGEPANPEQWVAALVR